MFLFTNARFYNFAEFSLALPPHTRVYIKYKNYLRIFEKKRKPVLR